MIHEIWVVDNDGIRPITIKELRDSIKGGWNPIADNLYHTKPEAEKAWNRLQAENDLINKIKGQPIDKLTKVTNLLDAWDIIADRP